MPSSQGSGRKGSALDSYLHFSCRLELEIVTFLEDFLEMVLGGTCQSVASELQALAAARSPTLLQNPGGGEEGDKWETGAGSSLKASSHSHPLCRRDRRRVLLRAAR